MVMIKPLAAATFFGEQMIAAMDRFKVLKIKAMNAVYKRTLCSFGFLLGAGKITNLMSFNGVVYIWML